MDPMHRHDAGFVRREFIQVGFSGLLGLGLPDWLGSKAAARAADRCAGRACSAPRKSVILVFLTGGLSHLDSFDMKPEAPAGIRGDFRPMATRLPGIHICEHLSGLAALADKLAIVRTMSHAFTNHLNATHEISDWLSPARGIL